MVLMTKDFEFMKREELIEFIVSDKRFRDDERDEIYQLEREDLLEIAIDKENFGDSDE